MNKLIDRLIEEKLTMVDYDRFLTIMNNQKLINDLPGDIVECGVWRGGMSIFLASTFPEKTVWVCDSFTGCQDPVNDAKYIYHDDPHFKGLYNVSLEEVQQNFDKFGMLSKDTVKFLPGLVKDTLHPDTCPIQSISVLRIDVDSYSATLEVLDYLYEKVNSGGIIIFDDSCLETTTKAINEFMSRGHKLTFYHPSKDVVLSLDNSICGLYCIKNN